MNSSAVIDMQNGDGDIGPEYGSEDDETRQVSPSTDEDQDGLMAKVRRQLGDNVTGYVWKSGSHQARQAFSLYSNIDILRPYFNVEPHQVRARLLLSLIPSPHTRENQEVNRELYGPLMVVFTMIALLLFQMKSSGHTVEEGTLMGTAFGTCFIYWVGGAWLTWFVSYVCNTHISLIQILSMMGYGMLGPCIVVFLGTVIHSTHDHMLFYVSWAVIGGLSAMKMVGILLSRTSGGMQKLIICGTAVTMHMLFIVYLHFAYHRILEDIADAMKGNRFNHVRPKTTGAPVSPSFSLTRGT